MNVACRTYFPHEHVTFVICDSIEDVTYVICDINAALTRYAVFITRATCPAFVTYM